MENTLNKIKPFWDKILVGFMSLFLLYSLYTFVVSLGGNDGTGQISTYKQQIESKISAPQPEDAAEIDDRLQSVQDPWSEKMEPGPTKPYVFHWIPLLRPTKEKVGALVQFVMPGPVNLRASATLEQINLEWEMERIQTSPTLKIIQPEKLEVQRRKENGKWSVLQSGLPSDVTRYEDSNIQERTRYEYRVVAYADTDNPVFDDDRKSYKGPGKKTSDVVGVRAKSTVRLHFEGVQISDNRKEATIRVEKHIRDQRAENSEKDWRSQTFTMAPGERIGEVIRESGFDRFDYSTNYTLKNIRQKEDTFFVEWKETKLIDNGRRRITVWYLDKIVKPRYQIIVEDERGNTSNYWEEMGGVGTGTITETVPWKKHKGRNIEYVSYVKTGPNGEDCSKYYKKKK